MQRTLALMRDRKEILLTGQYKGPLGLETAVSIRFRCAQQAMHRHTSKASTASSIGQATALASGSISVMTM